MLHWNTFFFFSLYKTKATISQLKSEGQFAVVGHPLFNFKWCHSCHGNSRSGILCCKFVNSVESTFIKMEKVFFSSPSINCNNDCFLNNMIRFFYIFQIHELGFTPNTWQGKDSSLFQHCNRSTVEMGNTYIITRICNLMSQIELCYTFTVPKCTDNEQSLQLYCPISVLLSHLHAYPRPFHMPVS